MKEKKIERGEQEKEDKSDILDNFLKIARALSRVQFERLFHPRSQDFYPVLGTRLRLFKLIHDHDQCKSLIAECDPNFSGWQKLRKSAKTSNIVKDTLELG